MLFALACTVGAAYGVAVIGPRALNPLDVSWITADPATAFLGWAFFRQEPPLTFPLGWSSSIGYPLGEPIAYLDSIPLLATLFWVIRGVLPQNFQYFGIYFVLCCILQFYFGFRISRRLCHGDRMAGVLGGALFLCAPAFTWRASGHFALASHWLILAALDQLLDDPANTSRSRIAWRAGLCLVAAGINPYITAMTVLVLAAVCLRTLLRRNGGGVRACIGFGMAVLVAVGGLMLFGFLRAGDVSQYAGLGYEKYSMNLLAPIDPEGYGALLLREQPIRAGQYEGYNYLGLGLLSIAVVAIARKVIAHA